jgi:general stress protein 26
MADMSLSDVSQEMRDIDFCMLSTKSETGALASRPMSNNRDVDYDGDSWFFAYDDARFIGEIGRDPHVGLGFSGAKSLLGKPGIFIHIAGRAQVIRDKAAFAEHWVEDLERWFPEGIDTPGMVMLKVSAQRVHYWDGEESGEVSLR